MFLVEIGVTRSQGVGFVTGVEALAKRSRCQKITNLGCLEFLLMMSQNHQNFMRSESSGRNTWRRRWNVEHHREIRDVWRNPNWQDPNLPHHVRDFAAPFRSWGRQWKGGRHRYWGSLSIGKAETHRRTLWSRSSSSSRKCGLLQGLQHGHSNQNHQHIH